MLDDPVRTAKKESVVVVGATSIIGQHLLGILVEEQFDVIAMSRQLQSDVKAKEKSGVVWYQSRGDSDFSDLPECSKLIHLAPLWILPDNLEQFAKLGVKRIVAFGSTSCFSKKDSPILAEREVAGRLELAEQLLTSHCKALNIHLTILRPTLVFEIGKDKNVSTIVNFIKRFGFFLLIGRGRGLRQPVSANDLALASVTVLNNSKTFGKAYNLTGSSTLTFRDMVHTVFQALEVRPRILSVPLSLIKLILPLVRLLPRFRYLNLEMFKRMNQDLAFDSSDAANDFSYQPQKFTEALSQAVAEK